MRPWWDLSLDLLSIKPNSTRPAVLEAIATVGPQDATQTGRCHAVALCRETGVNNKKKEQGSFHLERKSLIKMSLQKKGLLHFCRDIMQTERTGGAQQKACLF